MLRLGQDQGPMLTHRRQSKSSQHSWQSLKASVECLEYVFQEESIFFAHLWIIEIWSCNLSFDWHAVYSGQSWITWHSAAGVRGQNLPNRPWSRYCSLESKRSKWQAYSSQGSLSSLMKCTIPIASQFSYRGAASVSFPQNKTPQATQEPNFKK